MQDSQHSIGHEFSITTPRNLQWIEPDYTPTNVTGINDDNVIMATVRDALGNGSDQITFGVYHDCSAPCCDILQSKAGNKGGFSGTSLPDKVKVLKPVGRTNPQWHFRQSRVITVPNCRTMQWRRGKRRELARGPGLHTGQSCSV
ncbi:hypothetical protein Acsp05_45560 [Actinokineospora sp. NBRC 105648]|nr:hypothetical protein Acsp05_45560 [Actinokineospora sp. NBRC 105648]